MNKNSPDIIDKRRIVPENKGSVEYAATVKEHLAELCQICGEWKERQFSNVPQGYTYLGQFLIHELVENKEKPNRSWKLDLDSIYGDIETPKDQYGRFLYCLPSKDWSADLLRDPATKLALIPEPRNDDQMIIAQLHLLLLRFHNRVIESLYSMPKYRENWELRYEAAKTYVTACMQRIIFEDYLEKVCNEEVYAAYRTKDIRLVHIDDEEEGLPYEMTHAALRFGHSQIRSFYRLNSTSGEVPLKTILELTGRHEMEKFPGISSEFAIEWRFFFDVDGVTPLEKALKINPFIIEEMRNLPKNINVVEKNFIAGIDKRLGSGQELAEHFIKLGAGALGVTPSLTIQRGNVEREVRLANIGLLERTPIWLYVLIEADTSSDGHKLGPLGSILLCEAVRNAISFEGSVTYPKTQEEFLKLPDLEIPNIGTMKELIQFVF